MVDVLIVDCSSDVLGLFLPVIVLVFSIVIVVAVSVFGKGGVQFSRLINRFVKGKGMVLPVDGGVGSFEPGQS